MSKLLTIKEVAEILDVHPATIARWRDEENPVPYIKVGRQYRFEIENVMAWLKNKQK
jgi:excisionase family DNA binding protein